MAHKAVRTTGAGQTAAGAAMMALVAAGVALSYPSQNVALLRYPLGSIVASGWLDTQLVRLAHQRGSRIPDFEWGSAKGPLWDRADDGRFGHSGRGPGWTGEMAAKFLYGQTLLAYTSSDTSLRPVVTEWINRIISDQFREPNGYIGNYLPTDDRREEYLGYPADYELMALVHYSEANPGRNDVLAAARDYVGWFQSNWGAWGRGYAGQSVVEGALEVYKHFPADTSILTWCNYYSPRPDFLTQDYPSEHCVAYGLDVRIPALIACYDPSKATYRSASVNGIDKVYAGEFLNHGGPATTCENTFNTPTADNEMEVGCNLHVWSENFGIMAAITGEVRWADRLERIVFNATEGARKKDETAVPYGLRPNQYTTHQHNCYGDDIYHYGAYFRTPCCATASVAVLPNFVCSMYLHDADGGIYVVAYGPSVLKEGGAPLVTQTTDYPFGKDVTLTFHASCDKRLYIRIPGWSSDNSTIVRVNGSSVVGPWTHGAYCPVPSPGGRGWGASDRIEVSFGAMDSISVVRDSLLDPVSLSRTEYVSIERGPLLFACEVPSSWQVRADCSVMPPPVDMPWYEVEPGGDIRRIEACAIPGTDEQIKAGSSIIISPATGYLWENPSVRIRLPVRDDSGSFMTDLVPFGCTTLRKSYFPAITRTCAADPGPLSNFFGQLYTGARNNVTGGVGYEFAPTQDLNVAALGRAVSGSMARTHTITVWRVSDHQKMASVVVAPSSPTDSLGYKYELLCDPLALAPGESYRIMSAETSGGDPWSDWDSHDYSNHRSTATITQCCWSDSNCAYPLFTGGSENCVHGPVTFYTAAPTSAGTHPSAQGPFSFSVRCSPSSPALVFLVSGDVRSRGPVTLRVYSLRGELADDLTGQVRQRSDLRAQKSYAPGAYVAVLVVGGETRRQRFTVFSR